MDKKRMQQYKDQIALLYKKDKEITKRVEKQFEEMDKVSEQQERQAREKILKLEDYEVEYDDKNNFVNLIFFNDDKELSYTCSLWGEHFNKEEYVLTTPDPTFVRSIGEQNVFTGDNRDNWEDSEIFEVFYNNILKFNIKIKEY